MKAVEMEVDVLVMRRSRFRAWARAKRPNKAVILMADAIAECLQTVADAKTIVVCSFKAATTRERA